MNSAAAKLLWSISQRANLSIPDGEIERLLANSSQAGIDTDRSGAYSRRMRSTSRSNRNRTVDEEEWAREARRHSPR